MAAMPRIGRPTPVIRKPIVAGIVSTPEFCPMNTGKIRLPAPKNSANSISPMAMKEFLDFSIITSPFPKDSPSTSGGYEKAPPEKLRQGTYAVRYHLVQLLNSLLTGLPPFPASKWSTKKELTGDAADSTSAICTIHRLSEKIPSLIPILVSNDLEIF